MSNAAGQRPTATENTSHYTLKLAYDASGNVEYVGLAAIGTAATAASWQIRKLVYDASNRVTDMQWPGNESFTYIWNNRESLSYA